jgi:hypothetical protein
MPSYTVVIGGFENISIIHDMRYAQQSAFTGILNFFDPL